MNVDRAHGRWLLLRLAFLFPPFAGALATTLVVGLQEGLRGSLRAASLSLSVLLDLLLGWFLVQALVCARLQSAGRFTEARVLRRLLLPAPGVALVSLLVLCTLGGLPFLMPDPEPAASPTPFVPRPRWTPAPDYSDVVLAIAPAPEPAVEAEDGPAEPTPTPKPVPAEPSEPSPSLPIALAQDPSGAGEEDGYRFDLAPLRELPPLPAELRLERLGLPGEKEPGAAPPVLARLDALLLNADGDARAPAMALLLDFPLGDGSSFRTTYLLAHFTDDAVEPFEGSPDLGWARATFEYVFRLAGHTRHAPLDVSFAAGLSLDVLETADSALSGTPRLSPYVAFDLGLFEVGAFGLLLHAGQSIPLNVTGASAAVTDLSAMVRIDLTESISLHAGYRLLLVRFRDYDASFDFDGDLAAFDGSFAGPQFGLEIRF